jgi:hypothetical protein
MPYYVTMTDKFMSGWGPSIGKTAKLVIECETWEEAITVRANAMDRKMKRINICYHRPRYNAKRYQVITHDKSDYSAWFKAPRKPEGE